MTDVYFYLSAAACFTLAIVIGVFYGVNLQPKSSQNKSLISLIVAASLATSIVGWLMATFYIKGDVTKQINFLIFTVMILFAMNIVSGSVAAMQLYGLRDSIAANTQGTA